MVAMNTLLIPSWLQVCEDLPGFTNLFYDRLFATHSSLRELFRHVDAGAQDKHLQATLNAIANGQVSTARLIALGRRYAGYGVRAAHYAVIVHTLLWALEQQLGATWTLAVQNAWDDTLTRAATVMVASNRRQRLCGISGDNLILFPSSRWPPSRRRRARVSLLDKNDF